MYGGGFMFDCFRHFFSMKKEIRLLNYKLNALKFDLQHSLAISEKYIPLMKTADKVQLLILRRSLWTKN